MRQKKTIDISKKQPVQPEPFEIPQTDPEVAITLGKVGYTLCYDMAAYKKFYTEFGHSIMADGLSDDIIGNPEKFTRLFHLGLLRYQPHLAENDVDKILHPKNFAYVYSKIVQAITVTLPVIDEDDEDEKGEIGAEDLQNLGFDEEEAQEMVKEVAESKPVPLS